MCHDLNMSVLLPTYALFGTRHLIILGNCILSLYILYNIYKVLSHQNEYCHSNGAVVTNVCRRSAEMVLVM